MKGLFQTVNINRLLRIGLRWQYAGVWKAYPIFCVNLNKVKHFGDVYMQIILSDYTGIRELPRFTYFLTEGSFFQWTEMVYRNRRSLLSVWISEMCVFVWIILGFGLRQIIQRRNILAFNSPLKNLTSLIQANLINFGLVFKRLG